MITRPRVPAPFANRPERWKAWLGVICVQECRSGPPWAGRRRRLEGRGRVSGRRQRMVRLIAFRCWQPLAAVQQVLSRNAHACT